MEDLLRKDRISTSVGLVLSLLLAQKAVAFVRGILFARLLGTAEYGTYTLGFFLIVIMVSLTGLGIGSTFGRYTSRYQVKGGLRWFLRKVYSLNIASSVIVGVLILILPSFFSELVYGDASHARVMVAVALSIPALVVCTNLIRTFAGLKLFRASSVMEFSQVAIYSVVGTLVVLTYRTAATALIAYALATLASIALFATLLRRYVVGLESVYNPLSEPGFYRRLLRFTLWLTLIPVLVHAFHYVDRLSLRRLMTSSDQGIYSAAVNLSMTISAVGLAVNNVIYPHLSTTWEAGDKPKALRDLDLSIRVTTMALLVVGLLLVVLGRPIILLLLGEAYLPGSEALPYLVVFYLLTMSVWLFGVYTTLLEKTYVTAIGLSVALPINIVLNITLIPRMGIPGAGIATMISYFIMWCTVLYVCSRLGMPLRAQTVTISLLPFVLLLPSLTSIATVAIAVLLFFGTTWIVSKGERQAVFDEVSAFLKRNR